jgi:nucleoside-diphosphate-sugar epimerase
MKILLIGNEGFIGSHLSRLLMDNGHTLAALDIAADNTERDGYFRHKGDILNEADVMKAAEGCDMVINLAAKHHDFGISREDFFLINEAGTRNLVNCLSRLGIHKLIFYSSVAVYGLHDVETSEETPATPCNDYGESKRAGEKIIEQWQQEHHQREVLIVRPVVVYGPNNWANVFRLIDNIYHRRFIMVGDGNNVKSTAYVQNLIEATLFMMERMRPGLEVINYSDHPHKTSLEFANIIRAELGRKPLRFKVPLKLAAGLAYPMDILAKGLNKNLPITANRIKKFGMSTLHGSHKVRDLGYRQRCTTEDGLRAMVQWYVNKGVKERHRCARGT